MASDWLFNFWKKDDLGQSSIQRPARTPHELLIQSLIRFLTIAPRLPDLETEYQILVSELEDAPDPKTIDTLLLRLDAYIAQAATLHRQQQEQTVKKTQIQMQKICYGLEQRLGLDSARTSFALWLQNPDQIHDLEQNIEKLSFLVDELCKSKKEEAHKWDIFTQPIPPGEKAILSLGILDQKQAFLDQFGEKGLRDIMLEIARSLQQKIKRYDFFAQIEQQYFVMIFGNCELKYSQDILERLKEALKEHTFTYEGQIIPVTLSFGLMCLKENVPPLVQVQYAEQALVEAQKEGADRLIFVEHN